MRGRELKHLCYLEGLSSAPPWTLQPLCQRKTLLRNISQAAVRQSPARGWRQSCKPVAAWFSPSLSLVSRGHSSPQAQRFLVAARPLLQLLLPPGILSPPMPVKVLSISQAPLNAASSRKSSQTAPQGRFSTSRSSIACAPSCRAPHMLTWLSEALDSKDRVLAPPQYTHTVRYIWKELQKCWLNVPE